MLRSDQLNLNVSGSAKAYYQIQTTKLNSNISGSGMIQFTGKAKQSALKVSGSASINAKELNTEKTKAQVSGSGRITVLSSEELNAVRFTALVKSALFRAVFDQDFRTSQFSF